MVDGSYPPMNGVITRQPADASFGATNRHPWAVSGKPCKHNAIGASLESRRGFHTSARSVTDGASTSTQPGWPMAAAYRGGRRGGQASVNTNCGLPLIPTK